MVGIFPRLPLCKPRPHTSTSHFLYFSFPPAFTFVSFPLLLSLRHRQSLVCLILAACNAMNNFSMGFSCTGDDFDGKEIEAPLLDDSSSSSSNGSLLGGMDDVHNHVVEVDFEFWPVEHPTEPPDEDRPVKCPMPDSSVINDGGRQEKRFSESSSMRKRTELSPVAESYNKHGMDQMVVAMAEPPPVRAVRKRHHHILTRGDHMISPLRRTPPLPSLPTQSITVFQMLQQFDKFES